jgi:recombination directionality factor gp3-like protein
MTIIDLQRRIMEAGRIRIGQQVPTGTEGKTRPAKLDTFRLTSADRIRIEQAAKLFGGKVTEWQAPAGKQWEVITEASALDVIVPPSDMAFSQAYEMWSASGCQRRCDGEFEQISDGRCLCDPENRECDIHTRLSVMIRDLPGLGVWRIDTQGYYAAVELGGAVQVIAAAAGRGVLLPARLLLVQRSVIRRGPDGKPQTRRFAVPVLDVEVTPRELLGGMTGAAQLEAARPVTLEPPIDEPRALLTAVPDTLIERPVRSIADQATAGPEPKKPRANAAQPIPPTGLDPRTVTEAALPPPPEDEPADLVEPANEAEAHWVELYKLLAHEPEATETKPVLEGRLRNLYHYMDVLGLWKPGADGTDALHQALRKYAQAAHVSELNKEPLLAFCQRSWAAAKVAVDKVEA